MQPKRGIPPQFTVNMYEMLSTRHVAAMLGISQKTLRRMISCPGFPVPLVIRGKYYWRLSAAPDIYGWYQRYTATITQRRRIMRQSLVQIKQQQMLRRRKRTVKRKRRWIKRPDNVEAYFKQAVAEGKSQYEMARELGVSRLTVRNWMDDLGYECVITYRKRK